MKFAILAVVVAVFSSQAFGQMDWGKYFQQQPYQQQAYQQQSYQQQAYPQQAYQQQPNLINNFAANMDPQLVAEATDLLLKTVRRTNELIDNLPPMTETAAQMADLWSIAYPQLANLLAKAGA